MQQLKKNNLTYLKNMKSYKECQKTVCKQCTEENCYCKNPIYVEIPNVVRKETKAMKELKISNDYATPKTVRI